MDTLEENTLVRKLTAGDEAAWEAFSKQYADALLEFVELSFRCGREKSEEIVQMAFIRCVRSIATFDPARGRLFGWLKAVARNEGRTCLRGKLYGRGDLPMSTLPEHVLDQLADSIDKTPLPDELLARKDTQMLIRECLMELSLSAADFDVLSLVQFRLPASARIEELRPPPIETRRSFSRLVITVAADYRLPDLFDF